MNEQSALALTFAADLATQLITLATGVLALSVAFTKDILGGGDSRQRVILGVSWSLYLASVVFGIWSLMALTGLADAAAAAGTAQPSPIGFNARLPAFLQIVSFVAATGLIIWLGIVAASGGRRQSGA